MRPALSLLLSLLMIQFLALAPLSAAAQQKPTTELIPRSVLFGNPERADPQISPDGTQLGYLAPVDGVLNVWIRTLGKTDDRAVTSDTKRGIRNFTWQYDNQHILYTQDVGGDENWRLYQTDIATKQTKDLTPFEKVRVDVVAYDWKTPDTILFHSNKRDPKVFDVYNLDLKTGKISIDTKIRVTWPTGRPTMICKCARRRYRRPMEARSFASATTLIPRGAN